MTNESDAVSVTLPQEDWNLIVLAVDAVLQKSKAQTVRIHNYLNDIGLFDGLYGQDTLESDGAILNGWIAGVQKWERILSSLPGEEVLSRLDAAEKS